MADEREIVYGVRIDATDLKSQGDAISKQIDQLRAEQLNLNVATVEGSKAYKENTATLKLLESQQKLNQKQLGALTEEEKKNTDQTNFNNNSIKQNRELLKELNAEYIRLQKPTSDQTARLLELTNTLKKQESAIGDNRRNVGNYGESLRNVITQFPALSKGLDGFKNGLTAITSANPFGLLLQVLTPLIQSFLKLEPVTNTISGIFAGISATITTIASSVKNFFDLVSSGGGVFSSLSSAFGGLGERIGTAATEGYNLVQALDELEDAERANQASIAQTNRDTAILIAQSRDRTKSERERIDLLKEANELEQRQIERDLQISNQRVSIAAKQLATIIRNGGDRDKAEQDLADAQQKRFEAEQAFGTQTEKNQGRINLLIQTEADLREKAAEKRRQDNEKRAKEEEKRQADIQKRAEEAIKLFNDTTKAEFEFTKQATEVFYNEQEALLNQQLANQTLTQEEYDANLLSLQQERLQAQIINLEDYNDTIGGLSNEIAQKQIDLQNIVTDNQLKNLKKQQDESKKQRDEQIKQQQAFAFKIGDIFADVLVQEGNFYKNLAKATANTILEILEKQVIASATVQSLVSPDSILSFGTTGILRAGIIIGLIKAAFGAARVGINSFAGGGFTGSGFGSPDSSGFKPAGIVHENEYVVPKKLIPTFAPEIARIERARTSGVRGYADGGFVADQVSIRNFSMASMIDAIRQIQPVVSVQEITDVQNRLQSIEVTTSL